jgi:hypothetical protein
MQAAAAILAAYAGYNRHNHQYKAERDGMKSTGQ